MSQLTHKQQTFRVAFLGFTFMVIFTAFNSLQNIVSKLYEDYHYTSLGQTAVLTIYLSFAICNFGSSYVIKSFGFKKVMLIASLGYAIFQMTGLLIASVDDLSPAIAWVTVELGAVLCGASASVIWVAQGSYTSIVAGEGRKSELFGLFWALMMSSQIFGNLLIILVLGSMSTFTYFLILTILGASSSFLFMFLPSVSNKAEEKTQVSLKEEFLKVTSILKDPKYLKLHLFELFPGMTIGFYATFLYKLVKFSCFQEEGETDLHFSQRVNFNQGLVFIALGCSQLMMGILMNRFSERFCKFKMAVVGTLLVELAGLVSLICFFLKSYPLCFVSAFLWGSSETFLQTNINAMISAIFPNKVEVYAVYRIIFAVGVVATILLGIALANAEPYIFLTILLIVQVLASGIAINLKTYKVDTGEEGGSLITNKEPKDSID